MPNEEKIAREVIRVMTQSELSFPLCIKPLVFIKLVVNALNENRNEEAEILSLCKYIMMSSLKGFGMVSLVSLIFLQLRRYLMISNSWAPLQERNSREGGCGELIDLLMLSSHLTNKKTISCLQLSKALWDVTMALFSQGNLARDSAMVQEQSSFIEKEGTSFEMKSLSQIDSQVFLVQFGIYLLIDGSKDADLVKKVIEMANFSHLRSLKEVIWTVLNAPFPESMKTFNKVQTLLEGFLKTGAKTDSLDLVMENYQAYFDPKTKETKRNGAASTSQENLTGFLAHSLVSIVLMSINASPKGYLWLSSLFSSIEDHFPLEMGGFSQEVFSRVYQGVALCQGALKKRNQLSMQKMFQEKEDFENDFQETVATLLSEDLANQKAFMGSTKMEEREPKKRDRKNLIKWIMLFEVNAINLRVFARPFVGNAPAPQGFYLNFPKGKPMESFSWSQRDYDQLKMVALPSEYL